MQQPNSEKKSKGRSPNSACVVCGVALYRRPYELARVRHVACMAHRAEAQKLSGITDAQREALSMGRTPGNNHLKGTKKSEASKAKASASNAAYWRENKAAALARAKAGPDHYGWKGGITQLNQSIRQMTEYRRWTLAVRQRDGRCLRCGSVENMESHHRDELAVLIDRHGIKNRSDARQCAALWDIENGVTLCRRCHYAEHGRSHRGNHREAICEAVAPAAVAVRPEP